MVFLSFFPTIGIALASTQTILAAKSGCAKVFLNNQ